MGPWSSALLTPVLVPDVLQEAVGDRAWLQAMLDVEAALAVACAGAGAIPAQAAPAIAGACHAERFDVEQLGRAARASASPVVPLVRALGEAVGGEAARWVHWGATSQDVLDTAAMLVARRALDVLVADLDGLSAACAALAEEHRQTPMAGRTLMQQALPITFGLKAAGWLAGTLDARARLVALRDHGLAVQLGGAAGTLASLGDHGPAVLRALARELDLPEPALPWHTARGRVAELGAALAVAAGAAGKVALDVVLLVQTEVGEALEASAGGSSALPHKRNPAAAVRASACARRLPGLAATLLGAMVQEHERAAGAWQAEWEALRDALALTGGAVAWTREAVEGLEVDTRRMLENLDATGGALLAERVALAVVPTAGRSTAHDAVRAATARAAAGKRPLRVELLAERAIRDAIAPDELDRLLDPAGYLGSTQTFIDRALERHQRESSPV